MPTQPNPAIAIELESISKTYDRTVVLQNLSLSVHAGELLVLLGASGSGKTTLVRLIAGLDSPSSGKISTFGKDQSRTPPHRRDVAMLFQNGGAYDHLTVRENIALAASLHRTASNESIKAWPLDQLIETLELKGVLHQKPQQLSGGQLQRLAFARAIASQRQILLLDEPLAHLNETLRQQIRELLLEVHRQTAMTMVYVTHDSNEAMQLATRIAAIDRGTIAQIDTPQQMYHAPNCIAVAQMLGQPPMEVFEMCLDGDSRTSHVGVRPNDWVVQKLWADETATGSAISLERTNAGLLLNARVVEAKFMGRDWWLWLDYGSHRNCILAVNALVFDRELSEVAPSESPAVGLMLRATIDAKHIYSFRT
jgi:ABC-type sugar transport system ATPase subunit